MLGLWMSSQFLVDRRVGDAVVAVKGQLVAEQWHPMSLTFVSTNRFMVARISWCPETSSRVSGLYFSTLRWSDPTQNHNWGCLQSPRQTVFRLYGQICSASFPFGGSNVGAKHDRLLGRRGIHIHLIFVVWHLEFWISRLEAQRHPRCRSLGDADSSCVGENAPDSRWSRRRFTIPSHCLFLASEMRNESNGIDR